MMNLRLAGILGFIGFGAMLVSTPLVQAETLAISCGAVGQELEFCKTGAEAWAKQPGNVVNVVSTPNSATARLALYHG